MTHPSPSGPGPDGIPHPDQPVEPTGFEESTVSLPFWITIALFVVVGTGVVNAYYWKNVREELEYRQRKWRELQGHSPT